MERVSQVLANLSTEKTTPIQKITENDRDLTLEEKREELRRSLGLSSLEHTFIEFNIVPGTEEAYQAFWDIYTGMVIGKVTWKMLLCYGGVGNGKTHLCEATVIELYKVGIFCRLLSFDRMMGALKECIEPGHTLSLEELLQGYSYAERLIVDDIAGTPWELEQLEKIVRARYHNRLFTILTTNRDLKELPERIVSRFSDPEVGRLVLNEGEDYRLKK